MIILRTVLALLLLLLLTGKTPAKETIAPKIDRQMARYLVGLVESDKASSFDYSPKMGAPFFTFQALSPASTVGFFSANPWTGEVWALWGCYKINSPTLRKEQAAIRRKFAPAELKQYKRLSALKPFCIVER